MASLVPGQILWTAWAMMWEAVCLMTGSSSSVSRTEPSA